MRSFNLFKSFALLGLAQTAFGAYTNSTSTNTTSSIEPTPTAPNAAPYLVGQANGDSPLWHLHVPGELGPWVELTFSSNGGSNYKFDFDDFTFSESANVKLDKSGNSFTVTYTGAAPADEFVAGLYTSRTNSDSLFGITVYVAVDTGSGSGLKKRDVLTWTLTDYITIEPASSSVISESSSASGPYTYSSYTVTTLVVSGTETLTVTVPCESGTPLTAPTSGPVTLYTTTETVIGGVTTTVTVPCETASGYPTTGSGISTYAGAASGSNRFLSSSTVGFYVAAVLGSYIALLAF